jgi:hypothetical protein
MGDRDIQELYARWLDRATKVGFVLSVAAFLLYVSGALPARIAPQDLQRYWQLPVERFIDATGAPQGFAWLRHLAYGDYLCLAAVALFALVTLACYIALLPALLRKRDWLQAGLALAQVLVLAAALSGALAGVR